ncbi:MAG: hypothetical protein WBH44_10270 [Proteocatella sp.]
MNDFFIKVIDMCTIDDLMNGYVYDDRKRLYTCIFCGEIYEEDYIYKCEERHCTARKAVEIHVVEAHGSAFEFMMNLDKKHTGLTERQKEIYEILYHYKDNQAVSEKLGTTLATVRGYKFKMREKLRQVKIYTAISSIIEKDTVSENISERSNPGDIAEYEKQKKAIEDELNAEGNFEEDAPDLNKFEGLNIINKFAGSKSPGIK